MMLWLGPYGEWNPDREPVEIAPDGMNLQVLLDNPHGIDLGALRPRLPGVVSLPHGWGHSGSSQSVARAHAGVNANTLTDDSRIDVLSGNAVFNGIPVTIAPA